MGKGLKNTAVLGHPAGHDNILFNADAARQGGHPLGHGMVQGIDDVRDFLSIIEQGNDLGFGKDNALV